MWRLACAFCLGITFSLLACRTGFQEECPVGNENCACTEDGTCVEGLSCLSGVCVDQTADETGSEAAGETQASESSSEDVTSGDAGTSDTTGVGGVIVLWATSPSHQGNFDVSGDLRADFNAICQADLPDGSGCLGTAAIVSTAQEDGLGSLENNAGVPAGEVVSIDGVTVASSFAALIGEGPQDTLANLGVLSSEGARFWTGTDGNGHFDDASSCAGWTSASEGTGRVGTGTSTGTAWFSAGDSSCSEQASVLCVCW